jgi:hypothetical protein
MKPKEKPKAKISFNKYKDPKPTYKTRKSCRCFYSEGQLQSTTIKLTKSSLKNRRSEGIVIDG